MITWIIEFVNDKDPKKLLRWGIEFLSKNDALGFIKNEISSGNYKNRYIALYSYNIISDSYGRTIYFDLEDK